MTWYALVGAAGAWIGTFACIPPTWRVARRRSARDYSWWGAAGSMTAMSCTLIYLGSLGNWLAVVAQSVCYVAYLVIVAVKWRTELRPARSRASILDALSGHGPMPADRLDAVTGWRTVLPELGALQDAGSIVAGKAGLAASEETYYRINDQEAVQ